MDLRVKRTINNIENAFIELKKKKPIEKISVKELSEFARINKATFYLHYKDIYDLSEKIENKLIDSLFSGLSENNGFFIDNIKAFTTALFHAYMDNRDILDTVFSGSRRNELIDKIESQIKKSVFTAHPSKKDDIQLNTILTFEIKGAYYAFAENRAENAEAVINIIGAACDALDTILHS